MIGVVIVVTGAVCGGLGYILGGMFRRGAEADRIQEFYAERAKMQRRLQEQSDTILEISRKNAHYIMENQMLRGMKDEDDLK